jgi:hypothetical protein
MLNIELPIGKGVFLACKIAFWRELELLDFLAAGKSAKKSPASCISP